MAFDSISLAEILLAIAAFAAAGITYYGIRKSNKNTELVLQYAHTPYLTPFIGKYTQEKGETRKSIHVKNLGNGLATNITISIKVLKPEETNEITKSRAVFVPNAESHNMQIVLDKNMTFRFISTYDDVTNFRYHVEEDYEFSIEKEKPTWLRISTKRTSEKIN